MPEILRIVDANINRLIEGLRVVEDILRFYYQNKILFGKIRMLRHNLARLSFEVWNRKKLVSCRRSREDIGRILDNLEKKRKNIEEVVYFNLQRAKESLRVLEELSKLKDAESSGRFKKMRFKLYELEKQILKKI
ncbi:MAG: hypothetical protein B6D55_05945 [Candidatus Omnitrophica bacterium 4484_70.2]|nr:MAG: hypothetical protein B6D55_05945 [Candidatus Omnitrophica bacterium 4484_70.2]